MQNALNFHVPDMTCGHCVRAITAAVRDVDAHAALEFDLPAHRVRVTPAQAVAPAFADALAAVGYRAELLAAVPAAQAAPPAPPAPAPRGCCCARA